MSLRASVITTASQGPYIFLVVSISDEGQERNLVATDVRLKDGLVVVQAGGKRHVFRGCELIDIVPIGTEIRRQATVVPKTITLN